MGIVLRDHRAMLRTRILHPSDPQRNGLLRRAIANPDRATVRPRRLRLPPDFLLRRPHPPSHPLHRPAQPDRHLRFRPRRLQRLQRRQTLRHVPRRRGRTAKSARRPGLCAK